MSIKRLLAGIFFVIACSPAHAQVISFKDTVAGYNNARMKINKTGMKVLGSWGIASIADGGIGYFTAKQDEWKYFHEMNAVWGVVNTGIAALSLSRARKEAAERISYEDAYVRYKATKKLYLINAGLDVVYIAAGVGMAKYSEGAKKDAALWSGFGKSIVIQGVFLLVFDNIMYTSHARYNSLWFRVMNEIHVSNNGIGINHSF